MRMVDLLIILYYVILFYKIDNNRQNIRFIWERLKKQSMFVIFFAL